LTILDRVYVWCGCGSPYRERNAALDYAQGLAAKGTIVVELTEGESDDDELFWMMLGDDEYARADYWKWRRSAGGSDPRIWRIDNENGSVTVLNVPSTLEYTLIWSIGHSCQFVLKGVRCVKLRLCFRLSLGILCSSW
jgi:hypothetical protein